METACRRLPHLWRLVSSNLGNLMSHWIKTGMIKYQSAPQEAPADQNAGERFGVQPKVRYRVIDDGSCLLKVCLPLRVDRMGSAFGGGPRALALRHIRLGERRYLDNYVVPTWLCG